MSWHLPSTGDQSSGKSSVLEALSGVQFPRGSGLVTRCPTQLTMTRGSPGSAWRAKAYIHWHNANRRCVAWRGGEEAIISVLSLSLVVLGGMGLLMVFAGSRARANGDNKEVEVHSSGQLTGVISRLMDSVTNGDKNMLSRSVTDEGKVPH